jgi:hypothetical protein
MNQGRIRPAMNGIAVPYAYQSTIQDDTNAIMSGNAVMVKLNANILCRSD